MNSYIVTGVAVIFYTFFALSACANVYHPLRKRDTEDQQMKEDDDVTRLVNRLELIPHPEGGFFKETWRSDRKAISTDPGLAEVRDLGTNIYYLLRGQDFSAWHRLRQAEIFYWHAGGTLKVHLLHENGTLTTDLLCDVLENERCQYSVNIPNWTWLALDPTRDSSFVFIGDATFPGFDFSDWELGKESELVLQFPQHKKIIKRLTIA